MRQLLLTYCPVFLWVFTVFHLIFLHVSFRRYGKTKNMIFLLTGFVTLGLFYDALILACGTVMEGGTLLKSLSQVRYISHGALIPLLFAICAYALGWKKTGKTIAWIFTGIVSVLGIAEGIFTVSELKEVAGVCRYAASEATPGWANAVSSVLSYGTVVPLMIVGIWAWIKQKTPALFLSGFFMFAFSALGPATGNFDLIFFISMPGEILMVLFFYFYGKHPNSCQK